MYNWATHQSALVRHYNAWCNGMKEWLLKAPDHWQKMLANVPLRPSAPGKSAGSKSLTASPASEMKGLLTKYNWEYRRPCPNQFAMLDHWTRAQESTLDPDMLRLFLAAGYHIPRRDLRHTMLWGRRDVDWTSWLTAGNSADGESLGSSMLVPVAADHSAFFCRSVTTACFPSFCYLLGTEFTAAEIEEAWLKLPLVKAGKKNRGTNAGGRNRASNSNWKWS